MYLLKFTLKGKSYLLHNGTCFIGSENYKDMEPLAIANTAKALAVGGFDVLEAKTVQELSDLVGGAPYPITSTSGGLGVPFKAVEIVNL